MDAPPILIADSGWTRGALAAARALRGAGFPVGVAAPSARGLASASRDVCARHALPPLQTDPAGWIGALNEAIATHGYELVLPAADAELLAISALRDRLEAAVPYPEHERVVRAIDKLTLAEAAREAKLATPRTVELTDEEPDRWELPAMIKARLHAAPAGAHAPGRLEASVATTRREAKEAAQRISAGGGAPLMQEIVAGKLMAHTVVSGPDGSLLASVAQIADRTWPTRAGPSTRATTIEPDRELVERISRLLRTLEWRGLAQLQFIRDEGGRAHLIDFNARLYGSLALAVGAGPNLPAIWASSALGHGPSAVAAARPGVRFQWLEGDLRAAAASGQGAGALLECLRFAHGAHHPVWSRGDPRPAVHSAVRLIVKLPGYLLRAARGRRG